MYGFISNYVLIFVSFILFESCENNSSNCQLSYVLCESGQYKFQGSIVNGKKNGLWLTFEKDGALGTAESFSKDIPHGEFFAFWNDSLVMFHGFRKYGKRNGPFEQYSDNGNLSRKGFYRNDLKTGKWEEYTYDGRLNRIVEYFNKEETKVLLDNRLELPVPEE